MTPLSSLKLALKLKEERDKLRTFLHPYADHGVLAVQMTTVQNNKTRALCMELDEHLLRPTIETEMHRLEAEIDKLGVDVDG